MPVQARSQQSAEERVTPLELFFDLIFVFAITQVTGFVVADRAGRFRFEGPRPVGYEGRPPHIHLRVVAANHELLFTRYVPSPGARRGFVRLVLRPQRL